MNLFTYFLALSTVGIATCLSTGNTHTPINRVSFLKSSFAAAGLVLTADVNPSVAKEIDPALKGTKNDPAYQACLSQCIFECTKPKGDEQKTRSECIPECKTKCATNKQQLLIGTPIKKD